MRNITFEVLSILLELKVLDGNEEIEVFSPKTYFVDATTIIGKKFNIFKI